MEDLKLVVASQEYVQEIVQFRQEFILNNEEIAGGALLSEYSDVKEWLNHLKNSSTKETCPANRVPETEFLCVRVSDNKIIGVINVRHELNDYLLEFGGHIGYSIRKSERQKGYGTKQLELGLIECQKMSLKKVLITCDETNIASKKTIIKCGGVFEDKRFQKNDNKWVERYWFNL